MPPLVPRGTSLLNNVEMRRGDEGLNTPNSEALRREEGGGGGGGRRRVVTYCCN